MRGRRRSVLRRRKRRGKGNISGVVFWEVVGVCNSRVSGTLGR